MLPLCSVWGNWGTEGWSGPHYSFYLSGSCEWLTPPQIRPLQELQSVLQTDKNLLWLCLEQTETAWLWLACLLGQPMICPAKRGLRLNFVLMNINSFYSFQSIGRTTWHMPAAKIKTENWWKVSLPCISSKNVDFAGISTCCGIFRLLRVRFLEAFEDACKSLKIWLIGTSASQKTAFSELSRRWDLKAFKCLSAEVGT